MIMHQNAFLRPPPSTAFGGLCKSGIRISLRGVLAFVPIAVESSGRIHKDVLDLLSDACAAIGGSPGERQALWCTGVSVLHFGGERPWWGEGDEW